jgi:NADH-quinone oxidoreductase subunit H
VATLLFLGGWTSPLGNLIGPFQSTFANVVFPIFWFVLKVFSFLFLYIWVRGTLPRFRYDQLMAFSWKFLLPLSLANIVITGLVVALKAQYS